MNTNRYKLLLVEDDATVRSFVKTVLEANGYQVLTAQNCGQGLMMCASHMPDLVILDLGLPDRDGLDFIREIRVSNPVPIVVLSARNNESDKVESLDLGANDYVTKPFGTEELLARLRVALRSSRPANLPGRKFLLQDLVIDYDRRTVTAGGSEVHLTQTEYNILAFLSEHTGKVLTYSAIIGSIWGRMDEGSVKKLQVNMANIRKKLGSRPGDNRYIVNELGVGYRMLEE